MGCCGSADDLANDQTSKIETVEEKQDNFTQKEEKEETEITINQNNFKFMQISEIHRNLIDQYGDIKEAPKQDNSDSVEKLIRFGGYYSMGGDMVEGAFLVILVDVFVIHLFKIRFYLATIKISLDGINSKTIVFDGTFNSNKLVMNDADYSLNLVFKHEDKKPDGIITSFEGFINKKKVRGVTRNNATPYSVFIGKYLEQNTNKPMLEISNDYVIKYDNSISNDSKLENIPCFVYNITYSLITFVSSIFPVFQGVCLVLGTGCAYGLVCGDISLDSDIFSKPLLFSKQIQTITPSRVIHSINKNDQSNVKKKDSNKLAPFSGYYQIDAAPGAFISIEAIEDHNISQDIPIDYKVWIAISTDGKFSKKIIFDSNTGMSFDGSKLIIPNVLKIDLIEKYVENGNYGKLIQMSGAINIDKVWKNIIGCTYFHPVNICEFVGKYFKNKTDKKATLEVIKDSTKIKIKFEDKLWDKFLYIPIMYVGARIIKNKHKNDGGLKSIVLSFGPNSCIINVNYQNTKKNQVFPVLPK